jgi:predicted nuclease of predicted toxin-antitoxin system
VIVWVDAQLSPALAPWLTKEFGTEAYSVRYLNLVRAKDPSIFHAAREANVTVMTKDNDFILLQERLGAPPTILWVRCGNTSNAYLKQVLRRTFLDACRMIESGEVLVEITDPA